VPIYIQDNIGSAIGRDQPMNFRITHIGLQVTYGPNSCIDTISPFIDRTGGILANQTFESNARPKTFVCSINTAKACTIGGNECTPPDGVCMANTQSWLYSSSESNGLIPFTAAPLPGDLIGTMVFNLNGCAAGTINLVVTTSGTAEALLASDNNTSETVRNPPGGLSVVNGAINIRESFFTLAPCRVIDTRNPDGPLGGPALVGGLARTFAIANQCGIPADARAVSVNVSITNALAQGNLTFYPTGVSPPLVSTINYGPGQTRANNAILTLGSGGDFDVSCAGAGTVDLIVDVNGFFR
jgi:hypothetical protein